MQDSTGPETDGILRASSTRSGTYSVVPARRVFSLDQKPALHAWIVGWRTLERYRDAIDDLLDQMPTCRPSPELSLEDFADASTRTTRPYSRIRPGRPCPDPRRLHPPPRFPRRIVGGRCNPCRGRRGFPAEFGNQAMLLGQIGIETAPCPGKCGFCVFGEGHTQFESTRHVDVRKLSSRARAFAERGDLYALFLMTMHTFEFDNLLAVIDEARRCIPPQTQIVVNIGDFSLDQARVLRSAGVHGAYHVCRLREGVDTSLSPSSAVNFPGDS